MNSGNAGKAPAKAGEGRSFKSNAPKAGGKGFGGGIPGMDGLGAGDVVCPWEAFGDMEMGDLAAFGIV